jgi:hypothetical protein
MPREAVSRTLLMAYAACYPHSARKEAEESVMELNTFLEDQDVLELERTRYMRELLLCACVCKEISL